MSENIGIQDEISLSEVFKILFKKLKLLIFVLVAGVLVGGAFGAIKTYDVHYYGTTIAFHVNPSRRTDTDNDKESQFGMYGAYNKYVIESLVELLESESFAEVMTLDENGMPRKGISTVIDEKIDAGDSEGALEEWRKTPEYAVMISQISQSISFTHLTGTDDQNASLAKSFVYVNISVLNNENFAKFLRERVLVCVPEYVSAKMPVPNGYEQTNCQRITRLDEVQLTNPGQMASSTLKYALFLGAVAFVVACVAILIIDYSDKRLKNFERVMDKLNLPILGVIPTISDAVALEKSSEEVAK